MKVLHSYKVYRPDLDGGIPFVVATLSKPRSDDIDNEILVARLKGTGRKLTVDGVPVEAVTSFGTLASMPMAPTLPFVLHRRAREVDLVIHHAPFPLGDLVLQNLDRNVGLIVYWHADIIGKALLKAPFKAAIRRTLDRADRIIVADRATMISSDTLPDYQNKCTVVPYGADIEYWANCTTEEADRVAKLREQHPRMIVAIGRLVPYKGFDVLVDALKTIDGEVMFIGEGPLLNDLKAQAEYNGVADRVTFLGRISRSEVKAHLHAARAFAFPSVTAAEAFGIVQLEAMAAGLPIVNTSLPTAVPGIARHNEEGLTVAPHDVAGLSAALSAILANPELASRLGANARARAFGEYTYEHFVCRVKDIYREVVAERRSNAL